MAAVGFFGFDDSRDYVPAFVTAVALMTVWAGAIAFLPALLAIVLSEAFSWRSPLYYLVAGGLIGLLADRVATFPADPVLLEGRTVIMLAAGFVGGFTYWLIAGRLAASQASGD